MKEIQIRLTEKQFKAMLAEYHATDEHRQRMTQSEIETLAEKVNEKHFNVPLINERREGKILIKIIMKIDRFLYDNLPNELYDLIRSLDDGISDEEAKNLIKRLSKLANEKIDIPYIPEAAEYLVIRFVLALIVNALRKQFNIDKAAKQSEKINPPDTKDFDENDLEQLVV